MSAEDTKSILNKANVIRLNDVPVSFFMSKEVITLQKNYTVKGTIETFRVHKIAGAPIVDAEDKIIGIISEYDLLLQAASRSMSAIIEYKTSIIAVSPETTLKEVLVILYKKRLKWVPVINSENYVQGVVARIDVLNFIASNSEI